MTQTEYEDTYVAEKLNSTFFPLLETQQKVFKRKKKVDFVPSPAWTSCELIIQVTLKLKLTQRAIYDRLDTNISTKPHFQKIKSIGIRGRVHK